MTSDICSPDCHVYLLQPAFIDSEVFYKCIITESVCFIYNDHINKFTVGFSFYLSMTIYV